MELWISEDSLKFCNWTIRRTGDRLPFVDEFFDKVVYNSAKMPSLEELSRVLKLGGRMVLNENSWKVIAANYFGFELSIDVCTKIANFSKTTDPLFVAMFSQRGIGCGATVIDQYGFVEESVDKRVLEVGFGEGLLVRKLMINNEVHGIDVGRNSITCAYDEGWFDQACLLYMDASTEEFPYPNDYFDIAFCLETMEHIASPFHVVWEVQRCLKGGGLFVLSVPHQDFNDGYGPGVHAYVYPGLFLEQYFKRFFRQLYFQCIQKQQIGGSILYMFRNLKDGRRPNIFTVVAGNYDETDLYGDIIAGEV